MRAALVFVDIEQATLCACVRRSFRFADRRGNAVNVETRASVSPPSPPPMIVIGAFGMIPSWFEIVAYFPRNYGTSFHYYDYYGMAFHLCCAIS